MEQKFLHTDAFLNEIKNVTSKICYTENNNPAKRVIAIAIKGSGISKKDALSYIEELCNIPKNLDDKSLQKIIKYHIGWNNQFGKMLQNYINDKKKVSQEQFSIIASACGLNADELLLENKIDIFGWCNVLNVLKKESNAIAKKSTTKKAQKVSIVNEDKDHAAASNRSIFRKLTSKIKNILLKDFTTGKNIIWGTPDYSYPETSEMTLNQINDGHQILPRAFKSKDNQKTRTKAKAEVFTPISVVKKMNDQVDESFKGSDIDYINRTVLEVTCGEAPFLVNRYETTTGNSIACNERTGLLDRKMRKVNENAKTVSKWEKLASAALKATYGYEWQGDNLLLARVNVLNSMVDWFEEKFSCKETLSKKTLLDFANIISHNIIQMDGVKLTIPMTDIPAKVMNWKTNKMENFNSEEKDTTTSNEPECSHSKKTKKKIVMKNKKGEIVAEFKTSGEASQKTGICESSIRKSVNGYKGYQGLKKDGKRYNFEYCYYAVNAEEKTKRKYDRHKIAIVNTKTKNVSVFENVIKAAEFLGINKDEIYYRVKASNHKLNNMLECWYEDEYNKEAA